MRVRVAEFSLERPKLTAQVYNFRDEIADVFATGRPDGSLVCVGRAAFEVKRLALFRMAHTWSLLRGISSCRTLPRTPAGFRRTP